MKYDSLNSRMLVNGLMVIVGLTSIICGVAGKHEDHEGYQSGRNFNGTREEYREKIKEEGKGMKDIHKYSGYVFAGLMGVHLLQHYMPIKNYLKKKKPMDGKPPRL